MIRGRGLAACVVAVVAASACDRGGERSSPRVSADAAGATPDTASEPAVKVVSRELGRARLEGADFALDVEATGCRVDATCRMTIRLQATGGYHVNKEYPYKFVAEARPGVTFLGETEPGTFSRASGDFAEESEARGTMTVRFRAASPGETRVAGTYRMSVCSDEHCRIEAPRIELPLRVE